MPQSQTTSANGLARRPAQWFFQLESAATHAHQIQAFGAQSVDSHADPVELLRARRRTGLLTSPTL